MTKCSKWLFVMMSGLLLSGCIGPIFSRKTTIHKDVERAKVEFESDAAARLFYETMNKRGTHRRTESTTSFSIPILLEHSRTVVPGENRDFNEAVERCDTNRDGRITEQEAKVYANMK